jgi:hypothetical protein
MLFFGGHFGYGLFDLFFLPLQFVLAAPKIGLVWSGPVWRALGALAAALAGLMWPVLSPTPLSIALGSAIAVATAIYFALRASRMLDLASLVRRYSGAKP